MCPRWCHTSRDRSAAEAAYPARPVLGGCLGTGAVLQLGRGALACFRHATYAGAGRPSRAGPRGCRPRTRAGTAVRKGCGGIRLRLRRRRRKPTPWPFPPRADGSRALVTLAPAPSNRPSPQLTSCMNGPAGRVRLFLSRSPYNPEKGIHHVSTRRTAIRPKCRHGRPSQVYGATPPRGRPEDHRRGDRIAGAQSGRATASSGQRRLSPDRRRH